MRSPFAYQAVVSALGDKHSTIVDLDSDAICKRLRDILQDRTRSLKQVLTIFQTLAVRFARIPPMERYVVWPYFKTGTGHFEDLTVFSPKECAKKMTVSDKQSLECSSTESKIQRSAIIRTSVSELCEARPDLDRDLRELGMVSLPIYSRPVGSAKYMSGTSST